METSIVRRYGRPSSGIEVIPISNASALGEVRSGCHSSQTHTRQSDIGFQDSTCARV